jgi:hypothetical protein
MVIGPSKGLVWNQNPTKVCVYVHEHVLVDVDGFYNSRQRDVKHAPEIVKLLLPSRQSRESPPD